MGKALKAIAKWFQPVRVRVCSDCAIREGAQWPQGHTGCFSEGICDLCLQHKILSDHREWIWPNK